MTLLLALIVAQATYEERARAVDTAIVAERMRIASKFEEIKAWAWARDEYRKVLRLSQGSDVARKLDGAEALAPANAKGVSAQRYHDLTGEVAKVATTKHAELARWCAENGQPDQAAAHWRWVLLYSPTHKDAATALGFVGSGAAARDKLWKATPWKAALEKIDAGEPVAEESRIEEQWKVKSLKRKSGAIEWEALGLEEERFIRVIRQANAVVDFMRIALDDKELIPFEQRYLLLADRARYLAWIEDISGESADRRTLLRVAGGFYNKTHKVRVEHTDPATGERLEHQAINNLSAGSLVGFAKRHVPWLEEGTAHACEVLFRGKCMIFHSTPLSGSASDPAWKEWTDSSKWDVQLRAAAKAVTDPPMEELLGVDVNAMKPNQAAKCTSLARFLLVRHPSLYRGVAIAYRERSNSPRAGAEKGLGFSPEELDEFWRRWVLSP